jgi:predicted phage baseplate assembly protein
MTGTGRDPDCCAGVRRRTPRDLTNRPGLTELAYRVGSRADFLASMLAALTLPPGGRAPGPNGPPWPPDALRTREPDDPSIALLDAWAVVADVLTFYQERIANEGYLRTAREFRSVMELARLVGYAPRPGVSASTYLAFTLDPNARTTVPKGSKAQSVPDPGQVMQTFETSVDLGAREEWNGLVPRQARPQTLEPGRSCAGKRLFVQGITTQLKPNDPLLLVFTSGRQPARADSVTPDAAAQRTTIILREFQPSLPLSVADTRELLLSRFDAFDQSELPQLRQAIHLFIAAQSKIDVLLGNPKDLPPPVTPQQLTDAANAVDDLRHQAEAQQQTVLVVPLQGLVKQLNAAAQKVPPPTPPEVRDLLQQAKNDFEAACGPLAAYARLTQKVHTFREKLKGTQEDEAFLELARLRTMALRTFITQAGNLGFARLRSRLAALAEQVAEDVDALAIGLICQHILGDAFKPPPNEPDPQEGQRAVPELKRLAEHGSPAALASRLYQAAQGVGDELVEHGDRAPDLMPFLLDVRRMAYDLTFAILHGALGALTDEDSAGVARDTQVARRVLGTHLNPLLNVLNVTLESTDASFILRYVQTFYPAPGGPTAGDAAVQFRPGEFPELDSLEDGLTRFTQAYRAAVDAEKAQAVPDVWKEQIEPWRKKIEQASSPHHLMSQAIDAVTTAVRLLLPAAAVAAEAVLLPGTVPSPGGAVEVAAAPVAVGDVLRQLRQTLDGLIDKCRATDPSSNQPVYPFLGEKLAPLQAAIPDQPPASLDSLRQTLNDALGPLNELSGRIKKAVGLLGAVFDRLRDAGSLIEFLRRGLAGVGQEVSVVAAGGYPRIQPWLGELQDVLTDLVASLQIPIRQPDPNALMSEDPQQQQQGTAEGFDLGALLRSLPPPSAPDVHLALTLSESLAQPARLPSSAASLPDLGPELAALSPGAADLYTALANARSVRDQQFLRVEALRVKAAPFGATAPLRSVPAVGGPSGLPARTEEWPLASPVPGLRVTINPVPSGQSTSFKDASGLVELSAAGSGSSWPFGPLPAGAPSADQTVQTDAMTGKLSRIFEKRVLHLSLSTPSSGVPDLEVTGPDENGTLVISVSGGPQLQVTDGTDARAVKNGRALKARLANGELVVVSESADAPPPAARNILDLDATYDSISPGSFVVIERARPVRTGTKPIQIAQITAAETVSRSDYGLTAKVTRLTLDQDWLTPDDTSLADLRGVTVYAGGEELPSAGEPVDADIAGDALELDRVYDGLKPGRLLVVAGERTDVPGTTGVTASELAVVLGTSQILDAAGGPGQGRPHTLVRLTKGLGSHYKQAAVTISANVAPADHGETRQEALGSGDASQAAQQFTLGQAPLTHVASAADPRGVVDTLQVRVNGVLWQETPAFLDLKPDDRRYVLRTDDQGKGTVIFGDGKEGARLPTGVQNVQARYRVGLGKVGNLKSGQISQLGTRPLGVNGVINPVPATGGADRETTDQARSNAATGISALDRLVSVSDYEDFARSFAGIAKASAARLPAGGATRLHLTVAGSDDIPIDATSALHRNLVEALARYGDPDLPVVVGTRERLVVLLQAGLKIDAAYEFGPVQTQVLAALLAAFGFDRRQLGQALDPGEVVAAIQNVPGVEYATLDVLAVVSGTKEDGTPKALTDLAKDLSSKVKKPPSNLPIPVALARRVNGVLRPAQIAYLATDLPGTLLFREIKP